MTYYSNVTKLADALYMEIKNEGSARLRGKASFDVQCGPFKKAFFLNVVSSFADTAGDEVGVLCESVGNLCFLFTYDGPTDLYKAFVLDRTKIKVKDVNGCFCRRNIPDSGLAYATVKEGVVASFTREGDSPWLKS